MRIALLSDVHDNTDNLLLVLQQAAEMGCSRLFYVGDIVETRTLLLLLEEWARPADIVFGNNEYELDTHQRIAAQYPNVAHHGYEADIEVEGRRIFFTHMPRRAMDKACAASHHAVFYGHTHIAEQYLHGHTLVANPGEVAGVRRPPSFAVYNTEDNDVIFYYL